MTEIRIEDIFPAEYIIPLDISLALAQLEMYVFDDRYDKVATHSGWEYYDRNWNRHRVPRRSGAEWFRFSNTEAAEKFVTHTLRRDLEDFSFQYVDQEAVRRIEERRAA